MILGQDKNCQTGKVLVKLVSKKFGQRSSLPYTRENFRTVAQDPKSRQNVTSMANFEMQLITFDQSFAFL